jgi:hypothetical protein
MNPTVLQPWRDLALILLCIEVFILLLIPGVILFFAQKYLRQFRHWLKMPLLRVQVYALRAQHVTLRASTWIAGVPISLQMLNVRLRATARRFMAGSS